MISKVEEIKSSGKVLGKVHVTFFETLAEAQELCSERELIEWINRARKSIELGKLRLKLVKAKKEPDRHAQFLAGLYQRLTNQVDRDEFLQTLGVKREVIEEFIKEDTQNEG